MMKKKDEKVITHKVTQCCLTKHIDSVDIKVDYIQQVSSLQLCHNTFKRLTREVNFNYTRMAILIIARNK